MELAKLALRQCCLVVIPVSTACRQPLSSQQGYLVMLLAGLKEGSFAIACRFNSLRSFFSPFHPSIGKYLDFGEHTSDCAASSLFLFLAC